MHANRASFLFSSRTMYHRTSQIIASIHNVYVFLNKGQYININMILVTPRLYNDALLHRSS